MQNEDEVLPHSVHHSSFIIHHFKTGEPIMITTQEKRNRDRVEPKQATPIKILSASKSGSVLTVTFDQPVVLKGVPQYTTTVAGADPTSAVLTGPSVLALTFDAAITAATAFNIPFEDPGIRNAVGGFVSTSTFPLS
jgi:hypothetical protein